MHAWNKGQSNSGTGSAWWRALFRPPEGAELLERPQTDDEKPPEMEVLAPGKKWKRCLQCHMPHQHNNDCCSPECKQALTKGAKGNVHD